MISAQIQISNLYITTAYCNWALHLMIGDHWYSETLLGLVISSLDKNKLGCGSWNIDNTVI